MRIATSQFQATMNRGLMDNQSWVSKLTEQMASGNRILVPSDDPVGNVRVSRLTREEALINQYRDNIAAVKIRMTANESYLSSMTNDLTSVHDLMVWAADGGNTPADLNAMVTSLQSLRDSLYYTANQKDQEGRYIFAGTNVTEAPIVIDAAGNYVWQGNTDKQYTVVGNGITQATNVDVAGLETMLNQLNATITALSDPAVVPGSAAVQDLITTAMDGSMATLDQIAGKISQLGGAQNILSTLDDNHANVSLSNQTAILDLSQLDYAQAATELSGYNLALEASYKAYSKISGMSLFNIL